MQFIPRYRFFCVAFASAALVLLAAQTADAQSVYRQKIRIAVGPTVHVSKAYANIAHQETLAAGDLAHPGRLTSCSGVFREARRKFIDEYCYTSFDSGKTWNPTLRVTEGWGDQDPAIAYGLGDDVYAVSLVDRSPDRVIPEDPDHPPHHDSNTIVFKSTDGGHTWHEASRFATIDREYVAIDRTKGKYSGRVYIIGQGAVPDISGGDGPYDLAMWRSLDGGKTFLGPVQIAYPEGSVLFGVGTGAVLSDGTFVTLFGITKPGFDQNLPYAPNPHPSPNAELHVITTRDGGESFDKSHKIADIALDRARSEGGILNQLAADPGSKAFKDRLYTVFPAIVDDRIQIELSYSTDKGKTWSMPVVVNDDRSPEKGGHGPDHLLPSIGVNKDGVVLVSWYDRRESKDNLGWRMRAAASLDGGETFSASVPITPYPNAYSPGVPWDLGAFGSSDQDHSIVTMGVALNPFFTSAGHTSGLAVDADGTFHPTWIDNHSGIAQIWTSSLRVEGKAIKHGTAYLAPLDDVSKSVTFEFGKPIFDRKSETLTLSGLLLNTSKDTLKAPLKARVLKLESELGVAEILNADNGEHGTGAVWDFSSQLVNGKLASLKRSKPKTLVFRISDLRDLGQGKDLKSGILSLDARVYAKIEKPAKGKKK